MILTICPNTALDKVLFIEQWLHGQPMRTNKTVTSVGGKGLNSSVVLGQLGVETVALGFFEGKIGQELIDLLYEYGVRPDPVWVGGSNRVAYVIAEENTNIHSHIIVGELDINVSQSRELIKKFTDHLKIADMIIFAGTLPHALSDDYYYELITLANDAGLTTIIDSQKEYVRAAIAAKPNIVKMNWEEFGWTFSYKVDQLDALIISAKDVKSINEIENLIITLGKDGILALTNQGNYLAKAPYQKSVNAAGAGDSVSAVVAWRLSEGDDWRSTLLWSCAVSAASVLTMRTGDFYLDDVKRIMKDVVIDEIK
jgi:1-phosphofructokinase family hexose kinase